MIQTMADIKHKRFQNLRSYFREYCEHTGIHGLKFIGEKRSLCEKISWTVVFCLSVSTCIFVVLEVFKKWQKSPIIVNFGSEQVNIFDITFPAVTICPETKVYSDYFNYSFSLKSKEELSREELRKLQFMSLLCDVNVYYHTVPKVATVDEGFYEFMKKGSPPFLSKCFWMSQEFSCQEIFQPLYTDEGLCFSFNMLSKKQMFTNATENVDPAPASYDDQQADHWSVDSGYSDLAGINTYPRRALLSGSRNALQVNLVINNTDLDYRCTHFQGYKVIMHSPHRFPTFNSHYVRIPLKKSVSAAISPAFIQTADDVAQYSMYKRKCFFQSDMRLKYFSKYSQLNCRLECQLNLTMHLCGCVEFFMPRNKSMPICGTGQYECVKNTTATHSYFHMKAHLLQHMKNDGEHKMPNFSNLSRYFCYCPDMCNTVDYNVEITESDYDWPTKMESFDHQKEEGQSSSQLLIYFKGSTFIPLERNGLFGTFDFLANVGGLLGLFIGFSLLSMVECIYFLTLRIICNRNLYKTWHGQGDTKALAVPSLNVGQ